MLRSTELARFVTSLFPTAVKNGLSHRVLLTFNAATLHEFITRSKDMDEGTMAYLLPALLVPMQQMSSTSTSQDSIVSMQNSIAQKKLNKYSHLARKLHSPCSPIPKISIFTVCLEGYCQHYDSLCPYGSRRPADQLTSGCV